MLEGSHLLSTHKPKHRSDRLKEISARRKDRSSAPHSHPKTICALHRRARSNSHHRNTRGSAAQSAFLSATAHIATHSHTQRRSPPAKAAFAEPRTPAKAGR